MTMDKLNAADRSKNMSAIKSRDTKPELLVRRWLFSQGYRFRVNVDYISGHPDLFLRKYNTAIFVNGCFWHRHNGCKYAYTPKSNIGFWVKKFERNVLRDHEVKKSLRDENIKCLIIWECTIIKMEKNSEYRDIMLRTITQFLGNDEAYLEI